MTLQSPPWVLQSASHSAELFRRTLQAFLAGGGVIGSTDMAVTQNGTPNMSINVAAGQVAIPGNLGNTGGIVSGFTSQGTYFAYNDATVNLAISASNATNPRIDLVVASAFDAVYSGASNTVVLQVITGTPAPSPAPPTVPPSSVVLASIAVGATVTTIVTANLTDQRTLVSLHAPARGTPAGRIYRNSAQSIPTSTLTQIISMTTDFAIGGMTSSGTSITVPVAGKYLVSASTAYGSIPAASVFLNCFVNVNGSAVRVGTQVGTSGGSPSPAVSDTVACNAGDILTLFTQHVCGSTATTIAGTGFVFLSAVLVSI